MTDINRRDTSEISELSRAVFENPQVFIQQVEDRFRDQLRGMTEKVSASGSHIVLLCGPSSSGKTTTANLLVSDLSALGRRAVRISLDDFYRNREDMPLVGIFSQRGKDRPNQIGMTSVRIVSVDGAALTVKGLDAIDGTPVLDIKPYYPVYDKKDAKVPEWVDRLMAHYF